MAKVFGIITAIILSFAAFVAFKNKAAYETTITNTQAEKDKLTKAEAKLKVTRDTLKALPIETAGVEDEVAALKETEAKETKANAELTAQIEPIKAKLAENKTKLDAFRERGKETGNAQELASKLRATSAEIEELNQTITTAEAQLANLTSQNTSASTRVTTAKTNMDAISKGDSLPSLRTSLRSIFPDWGFVTLNAGNNDGVIANSKLNVVRDGATIAQLLVTAVESNTASASIIPGTLLADTTLQSGDDVVPGFKEVTAVAN